MKLYKIVAENAFGKKTVWVGTQEAASNTRKGLREEGWKRDHIVTHDIDVPTSKQGLLTFLNEGHVN